MPNVRIIAKGQRGDSLTKLKVNFAPSQSSAPSLYAETNSVYLSRPTEGTGELMELVGGTVAWNQIVNANPGSSTVNGITFVINADGSVTVSGTATAQAILNLGVRNAGHANHVRYVKGCPSGGSVSTYSFKDGYGITREYGTGLIEKPSIDYCIGQIIIASGYAISGTLTYKPQIVDLTQLLGSELADYVYSLEQSVTGSGIAWLKSYGYFTEDYYAYSAPTLQSVEATSHIAKDGNGNVISTTTFGSVTLRGILKKDADGNLYYDGDTYEWDGTVTRKYGTRAYQAGDESLTDAITDGTNTVYKLTTPTTESADPFTAVQTVVDGGTEEFVTTNNVPVGVKGRFANAVPMEGVDSFTVTANDGTSHTYPVTLSEEIYRGYVDMLTGEAVSDMASIAEYNGETISEPWLSSLDVYSAGATPTNGAQVVYPITPEEVTATITGDPTELGEVTSVTSTKGTAEWSAMAPLDGKCIVRVVS